MIGALCIIFVFFFGFLFKKQGDVLWFTFLYYKFLFLQNLILINRFFLVYYGYQLEQKPVFFRLIRS